MAPTPAGIARRLAAALFYLVVGGFFLAPLAGEVWGTLVAGRWPERSCDIVESGVVMVPAARPGGRARYRFDVLYRYEVGGTTYEGRRVGFSDRSWPDRRMVDFLELSYPAGSRATCWVSRGDPRAAILQRPRTGLALVALLPGVLVLFGVWRLASLAGDLVEARGFTRRLPLL